MSASPIARQATQSQSIPSRHVVINDASQLPMDYSTTPGGTLYSTTPGAFSLLMFQEAPQKSTRIVYDRSFLLQLRNSPATRTPPKNLPVIPGITTEAVISPLVQPKSTPPTIMSMAAKKNATATGDEGQEQFQLEI